MTRIACLDEWVWKELFLLNRETLLAGPAGTVWPLEK